MSILHYVFEAGDAPRLGCAEMGCSPPARCLPRHFVGSATAERTARTAACAHSLLVCEGRLTPPDPPSDRRVRLAACIAARPASVTPPVSQPPVPPPSQFAAVLRRPSRSLRPSCCRRPASRLAAAVRLAAANLFAAARLAVRLVAAACLAAAAPPPVPPPACRQAA